MSLSGFANSFIMSLSLGVSYSSNETRVSRSGQRVVFKSSSGDLGQLGLLRDTVLSSRGEGLPGSLSTWGRTRGLGHIELRDLG